MLFCLHVHVCGIENVGPNICKGSIINPKCVLYRSHTVVAASPEQLKLNHIALPNQTLVTERLDKVSEIFELKELACATLHNASKKLHVYPYEGRGAKWERRERGRRELRPHGLLQDNNGRTSAPCAGHSGPEIGPGS